MDPKSIYTREYAALLRLVRQAREAAGLTQVDLAAALGRSQSFVSKVERGETRLDVIQLRAVLLPLGVSLPEFTRRLERAIAKGEPKGS
ncbi:MAG: helix-turn-helix transcriptional regulator [Gemmataceae bacterium]